jgi:hypothetical protein
MNENKLKTLFVRVEKKYLQCWDIISSFKLKKPESPLYNFQGLLCEALFELSNGYRRIHQVRQNLIKRKSYLSKEYFTTRQRVLDERQKAIIAAIGIGRAIGDAFVWLFFHNDRELLEEHSKHQYSVQMPPGIGGIGEMWFAKNVGLFGDYMIIYHGITTILRIGDVTFFDLKKHRVAGIGEIKTGLPDKNKINVDIIMRFTEKNLPSTLIKNTNSKNVKNVIDKLPSAMKQRLNRQMKKINNALYNKDKKPKTNLKKQLDFHYKEFEELLKKSKTNRFSYSQFSHGLLCAVYKQKKRSLYAIVRSKAKSDFHSRLNELVPRAKKIILKGSDWNNIKIEFLMYSDSGIPYLLAGAKPVFWWPIDIEMIRKIIFHEFLVFTIYNPAHLLNAIEKKGYSVTQKDGNRLDFKIKKNIDGKIIEYQNLWFFIDLITQSFIRETEIVDFVLSSASEIQKIGDSHNSVRADFRLNQML